MNISTARIMPNPNNPRASADAGALAELTTSIAANGMLQPIVVRAADSNGIHTIICGHRRFAAARKLGLAEIEASVLDVSDDEAARIALIENLQREDLAPLDEARGYTALRDGGQTIPEIAVNVSRSRSHIAGRLALIDLPEAALAALEAGNMTLAVAGEIARLPGQDQREAAAKAIVEAGGNRYDQETGEAYPEPVSLRRVREIIRKKFMTDLERAPFDTDDAYLVPAAGSCAKCSRRTGNSVDLFGDLLAGPAGSDICTYPPCFESKTKANVEQQIAKAKAEGFAIVPAKQAAKMFGRNGSLAYNAAYVEADTAVRNHETGRVSKKTYRSALGKKAPEEYVAVSPLGEPVHLYLRSDVNELLAAKSKSPVAGPDPAPRRDSYAERAMAINTAGRIMREAVAASGGLRWSELSRIVAAEMLMNVDAEDVAERRGMDSPDDGSGADHVAALDNYEVLALIAECALSQLINTAARRPLSDVEASTMATVEAVCGFNLGAVLRASGQGLDDDDADEARCDAIDKADQADADQSDDDDAEVE